MRCIVYGSSAIHRTPIRQIVSFKAKIIFSSMYPADTVQVIAYTFT